MKIRNMNQTHGQMWREQPYDECCLREQLTSLLAGQNTETLTQGVIRLQVCAFIGCSVSLEEKRRGDRNGEL
jgi:hypothetical protein